MGLETGTFINNFVTSNPLGATDPKSQGDDHLRLIKTILQASFPDASRAFRYEKTLAKTSAYTIVAADDRTLILGDATSAAFSVTLLAAATAGDGYTLEVKKTDSGSNAVTVAAAGSETVDGAASIVLATQYNTVRLRCDGSNWHLVPAALLVGTDVQAFGAVLDDLNTLGVAAADGEFIVATGAGAFAYESGATVRTSLGLGTAAIVNTGVASGDVPLMDGTGYPVADGSQITGVVGVVKQVVFTETGAVATGTALIPKDDTIPQITEGDEYMTRTITPGSTSNRLVIDVVYIGEQNTAGSLSITVALFRDAVAGALAVGVNEPTAQTSLKTISFRHIMTAPSTSQITFRVRAGLRGAGTLTFNGENGVRRFGGVLASSITITEIGP